MPQVSERAIQELEVLAGIRSKEFIGGAAVKLDDLNGLLAIPDRLKVRDVLDELEATPPATPEELLFAAVFLSVALSEDVQMLHTRLRAIVVALRARRGR